MGLKKKGLAIFLALMLVVPSAAFAQTDKTDSSLPISNEEVSAKPEGDTSDQTPSKTTTEHEQPDLVYDQTVEVGAAVEQLDLPDSSPAAVPMPLAGRNNEQTSNDPNVFLDISPVNDTVLSGEDVFFKLTVKFTGAKRVHKNVTLTVDIPVMEHITFDSSAESLEKLAIDGVEPTFDNDKNQLIYEFAQIERGQTYEKIIPIGSENGYIVNGTEIPIKATLTGETHFTENDEAEDPDGVKVESFDLEDEAKGIIESTSSVSITKSRVSPESGIIAANIPEEPKDVVWKIEIEVPKKDKGQMYLKENTNIVIEDTLPADLLYVEMIEGENPTQSGNKLTWSFPASSYTVQESETGDLFTKTLIVKTSLKSGATLNNKLTNNSSAVACFIDDKDITKNASADVYIAGNQGTYVPPTGSPVIPGHIGPSSGTGTIGTWSNINPKPTVTDDATLRFHHDLVPLQESLPTPYSGSGPMQTGTTVMDFQDYKMIYDIDPNLRLETVQMPAVINYAPKDAYYPGVPFAGKQPSFAIYGVVDGSKRLLVSADQVELGKTYTREELGLGKNEKLTQIIYDFHEDVGGYAPGGMCSAPAGNNSRMFEYFFSILPGTLGEVENSFNTTGVDGLGQPFDRQVRYPNSYTNGHKDDLAGPRQATIIAKDEGAKSVGEVSVELLEHNVGLVTAGENRMKVVLKNVNDSLASMDKELETVVLIPPGVTLATDPDASYTKYNKTSKKYENVSDGSSCEILDNDYNESGRQLVKISWDDVDRIVKGESVVAELDVVIGNNAPNQLWFDVYGYSNNDNLQAPDYSEYVYTNTLLQTDMDEDLNKDGNIDAIRLKSANKYTLIGDYDLQTEKLINGPCDGDEYSKFTLASPGDEVKYKLKLTNTTGKDISFMTLIDVFPSVGDLGITDGIERGSKFSLDLKGAITLSDEWQGKVAVYYSEATNPERDDLVRNVNYPAGTAEEAKLGNPAGAEDPNWMAESQITDWSSINSFKVELMNDGTANAVWIQGQEIELDFTMLVPSKEDLDPEVLKCDLPPQQRAAWNSFAASTEQGQVVEPERVGVAIKCTPPSFEFTKTNEDITAFGEGEAEFTLYSCTKDHTDATEHSALVANDADNCWGNEKTAATDADGKVKFEGLQSGNYMLVETKTKSGYQLPTGQWFIEVDAVNGTYTITARGNELPPAFKTETEGDITTYELPNYPILTMPHAGGMGTLLFTIGGIALIGLAAIIFVATRKRKQSSHRFSNMG